MPVLAARAHRGPPQGQLTILHSEVEFLLRNPGNQSGLLVAKTSVRMPRKTWQHRRASSLALSIQFLSGRGESSRSHEKWLASSLAASLAALPSQNERLLREDHMVWVVPFLM